MADFQKVRRDIDNMAGKVPNGILDVLHTLNSANEEMAAQQFGNQAEDPIDSLARDFGKYGVAAAELHNLNTNKFHMRLLIHRSAAPEIIDHLQKWLANTNDTNEGYYMNFDMKGLSHAAHAAGQSQKN